VEYQLNINKERQQLTMTPKEEGQYEICIGEASHNAGIEWISEHILHLTIDGKQSTAYVADGPDGKIIMIDGQVWFVEDQGTAARKQRCSSGQKTPTEVRPPMPAVVSQVLVEKGNAVKAGQGVIVVSAMKMETTLTAPFDGIVENINASVGDKVTPKQILVDITENKAGE